MTYALTKDTIKPICEADDKLQWWAMVLFAEISELVYSEQSGKCDERVAYSLIRCKVMEFPRLVISRVEKQAEGKLSLLQELEQRIKTLEAKLDV